MNKISTNILTPEIGWRRPENLISEFIGRLTFVILAITLAFAATSVMAQSVVYNAVDNTLAPNYPSLGYQATSTYEMGDYVHLAGTERYLNSVTVTMSAWAKFADFPAMSPSGWTHPITINVYNVVPGAPNTAGSLIGSVTQTKNIPWRPAADPINCPGNPTAWQAIPGPANTNCYNGYAFNLTFDMSSLNATLPNDVIVSIAYRTQSYGDPAGLGVPGPYNSLNVAVLGTATVGTDDNTDRIFWDTTYPGYTRPLKEYTGWTPNGTVNFKITATPVVRYVDDDGTADSTGCDVATAAFSTITAAVTAAGAGDVISVCPGTYNENPAIDKSLTLQSTGGRDVTIIQLPTSAGGYPYGAIELSGPNKNITIDGFTVRGNDGTGSTIGNANIMLGNTSGMLANSNVVLTNNKILIGKIDFILDYSDSIGVTTTYTTTQAEYLNSLTMTNNIIENLGAGQAQRPYYVNPGTRTFTFQNNQINGNFQRLAVSEADTTAITGNVFAGTNPSGGFGVNDGGSSTYNGTTFTNNSVASAGTGLYVGTYSGAVNATVTGNSFTNNVRGVYVPFTTTGTTVNFNRIAGNSTAGIDNVAASAINAENNWWGCNYGPGATGAGCSGTTNGISGAGAGNVDANPWLRLTTSAATPSVIVGGTDAVTSLLTTNSDNNTPGGGFVRNGTPAAFAGSFGTVAPPSSTTTSGSTGTVFTGTAQGVGGVATTVDGQTVSAPIIVYPAACAALSMPNLTTLTGQPITVPVNTDEMTGRGAISADFTVTYNPAVLQTVGANFGVSLSAVGNSNGGGRVLTVSQAVPGTLVISVFGTEEFQGSGSLVNLNFNVIGAPATTSPMTFSSFTYNEGTPCLTTTNGLVTVLSGTITGEVTYGNAIVGPGPYPRHVPGTTLNAVGSINQSVVTALNGTYTLSGMGAGAYVVTPSKTGDDQGALTGFDSACIAQYVVAQAGGCMTSPSPTAAQLTVADVSGNSTITSFDAALIARYAAALPGFGNTGQWRFTPTSIPYPNVNTNQTGQNYVALLMGDVSGNWINGLATRPAPVFPDGERPMRISAPSISAPVGTEVTIPVDIQDTTGKGILSYEFDLRFDPRVLEPAANTVDLTGTIGEGQTVTVNSLERGKLRVVVYGTNALIGAGHLLNLKFNVIGDVNETSDLTWESFNINEGGINFEVMNGRVAVRAASNDAAIAGRVLSAAGQPVGGATVTLVDTNGQTRTARTSSLGNFRFAELTVGQTYTVSVSAKRYTFASQTVSVTGDAVSLDLIAEQ